MSTSNSSPHDYTTTDPDTTGALLAIAQAFNADYSANKDALVYGRMDRQSQAVISEAAYVRRHQECPSAPPPAVIEGASRATMGYWVVHYSLDGSQLADFWHYVHHRWLFDLFKSNPNAVKLYELSGPAYLVALGCSKGH